MRRESLDRFDERIADHDERTSTDDFPAGIARSASSARKSTPRFAVPPANVTWKGIGTTAGAEEVTQRTPAALYGGDGSPTMVRFITEIVGGPAGPGDNVMARSNSSAVRVDGLHGLLAGSPFADESRTNNRFDGRLSLLMLSTGLSGPRTIAAERRFRNAGNCFRAA